MVQASSAQILLSPKPEKATSEEVIRPDSQLLSSKPALGWHLETGVGAVLWGIESQCQCNALTADIGFYHVAPSGFRIGGNLLLTNTISSTLTPSLKVGYQAIRTDHSLGIWSANVFAGPSVGAVIRNQSRALEKYTGILYGGELAFHPRMGSLQHLHGIIAIGWITQREKFQSENWQGPMTTKTTHSGLRIRFGITI
ncbi:MAG: hypothetical protein AB8F78_10175 [Saprospiraceae bacterium]